MHGLTLILAFAHRACVLQVGDRLVTQRLRAGAPRQPFDELANKCVIFAATDAVVAVSYTGVAYVAGKPTDVWLAEALDPDVAGGPHVPGGPPMFFRIGGFGRRIDLGATLNIVGAKLRADLAAMPPDRRGDGVTLQVVGWKWRRRRPRIQVPIMWALSNSGSGDTLIERAPRWFWLRDRPGFAAIGDRRTNPVQSLQQSFQHPGEVTVDTTEQLLVKTIRDASASPVTERGIGADCISVLIGRSDVRVRYLPASSAHAAYDVYTPWVVVPGVGSSAPAVLTGGLPDLHLGRLDVRFERAAPPTGVLPGPVTISGQERRPDPFDP